MHLIKSTWSSVCTPTTDTESARLTTGISSSRTYVEITAYPRDYSPAYRHIAALHGCNKPAAVIQMSQLIENTSVEQLADHIHCEVSVDCSPRPRQVYHVAGFICAEINLIGIPVYGLTNFSSDHPSGVDALLSSAGTDGILVTVHRTWRGCSFIAFDHLLGFADAPL
jgi:hypothetical protein